MSKNEAVIQIKQEIPDCAQKSGKRKLVLNKTMKTGLKKYQHKHLFFIGALIFAKLSGHPVWPAKIINVLPRSTYEIVFFGTDELGKITISNVYQYCDQCGLIKIKIIIIIDLFID
jgi:hypothetical protein